MLLSISDVALMYISQRRWTEAEELQAQVIEIRQIMLGEEHQISYVVSLALRR
jgi:hypothetical protein